MNLSDIIRAAASRMQDIEINVDTGHGWIAIGENIFLQGEDANAFLQAAEDYYEQYQDVTITECYACVAETYMECLG